MPPASDTRPEWARNLPELASLQYTSALITCVGLVLAATWVMFRVVRDPASIARIGKKAVG